MKKLRIEIPMSDLDVMGIIESIMENGYQVNLTRDGDCMVASCVPDVMQCSFDIEDEPVDESVEEFDKFVNKVDEPEESCVSDEPAQETDTPEEPATAEPKTEKPEKSRRKIIDREKVAELHAAGKSNAEIAKIVGCSEWSVWNILKDRVIEKQQDKELRREAKQAVLNKNLGLI